MGTEQIDGGAVREIERLTKEATAAKVVIAGREYATVALVDPRKPEPLPEVLGLSTLGSFVDYYKSDTDAGQGLASSIIHVFSPTCVRLVSEIHGEFRQRTEFARATAVVPKFAFGTWIEQQEFVISLLAQFEPTPDREKVLALVANIKWENSVTATDDGRSQVVTARRGIATVQNVMAPEIVMLKPYRTFSEVEQPESPFLLRINAGEGKPHVCRLEEADGGRWRLVAVKRIAEWLRGEVGEDVEILA